MITLLMAFFVMMYSMSVVDLKRFDDLAFSMSHVFGGLDAHAGEVVAADTGLLEGGRALVAGESRRNVDESGALTNLIQRRMKQSLPAELRDTLELTRSAQRITISMQASAVTFPVGQATLTPQARQILTQLGAVLSQVEAPMLIEGHTCDLPINTQQFPSNWELSAARANAVMVFLVRQCHIAPERIAAVGYAATRPRVPNTSEANRRRNRRVDIVILPDEQTRLRHMLGLDRPDHQPAPDEGRSILPRPVQVMPPMALAAEYHARQAAKASDPTPGPEIAPGHEEEQP